MTTFEKFKELIERAEVLQLDEEFLLAKWVWNPDNKTVPLAVAYQDEGGNEYMDSFQRTAIEDATFFSQTGLFVVESLGGFKTKISFHKLENLK